MLPHVISSGSLERWLEPEPIQITTTATAESALPQPVPQMHVAHLALSLPEIIYDDAGETYLDPAPISPTSVHQVGRWWR